MSWSWSSIYCNVGVNQVTWNILKMFSNPLPEIQKKIETGFGLEKRNPENPKLFSDSVPKTVSGPNTRSPKKIKLGFNPIHRTQENVDRFFTAPFQCMSSIV